MSLAITSPLPAREPLAYATAADDRLRARFPFSVRLLVLACGIVGLTALLLQAIAFVGSEEASDARDTPFGQLIFGVRMVWSPSDGEPRYWLGLFGAVAGLAPLLAGPMLIVSAFEPRGRWATAGVRIARASAALMLWFTVAWDAMRTAGILPRGNLCIFGEPTGREILIDTLLPCSIDWSIAPLLLVAALPIAWRTRGWTFAMASLLLAFAATALISFDSVEFRYFLYPSEWIDSDLPRPLRALSEWALWRFEEGAWISQPSVAITWAAAIGGAVAVVGLFWRRRWVRWVALAALLPRVLLDGFLLAGMIASVASGNRRSQEPMLSLASLGEDLDHLMPFVAAFCVSAIIAWWIVDGRRDRPRAAT